MSLPFHPKRAFLAMLLLRDGVARVQRGELDMKEVYEVYHASPAGDTGDTGDTGAVGATGNGDQR